MIQLPTGITIIYAGETLHLSLREAQCLWYTSRGYSVKKIAQHIAISPRTVETYLEHVRQKTRCHSKLELIGKLDREQFNYLREWLDR